MEDLTAYGFVSMVVLVAVQGLKNVPGLKRIPTDLVAVAFGPALLALYQWSTTGAVERTAIVYGVAMSLGAIGVWNVSTRTDGTKKTGAVKMLLPLLLLLSVSCTHTQIQTEEQFELTATRMTSMGQLAADTRLAMLRDGDGLKSTDGKKLLLQGQAANELVKRLATDEPMTQAEKDLFRVIITYAAGVKESEAAWITEAVPLALDLVAEVDTTKTGRAFMAACADGFSERVLTAFEEVM